MEQKKAAALTAARLVMGLFILQLCMGGLILALLAPVWLQPVHLLV